MRYFLLCTSLCLLSAPSLADSTFKICSRSPQENATVSLDDLGAFHVTLTLANERFVSTGCKPLVPSQMPQVGIESIECSGDWNAGKGSVILDSLGGVLNLLMYKGPEPLPSHYYEYRALFCGAPGR